MNLLNNNNLLCRYNMVESEYSPQYQLMFQLHFFLLKIKIVVYLQYIY